MTTGYERDMYHNIEMIRKAVESIAKSLEKIANPVMQVTGGPPDSSWVQTAPIKEA